MPIRGIGRLKQVARRIHNRVSPGTVILLYHRIVDLPSDPQLLCVSPRHFAEHIEVLTRRAPAVSLQHLSRSLQSRTVPKRRVVVTFDDGTVDNLYNAKPILAGNDCPATVFIATGNINSDREFWWDELDRIFLQPRKLPEQLRVNIDGKLFERDLGPAALYSEDEFRRDQSWNVLRSEIPGARQSTYISLFDLLRPLTSDQRRETIVELQEWSKAGSSGRRTHEVLACSEIRELADGDLIQSDIGVIQTLSGGVRGHEHTLSRSNQEGLVHFGSRRFEMVYQSREFSWRQLHDGHARPQERGTDRDAQSRTFRHQDASVR